MAVVSFFVIVEVQGLNITFIKLDPYINVDPCMMMS
ncbi:MAG: hypothetical protein ACTS73_00425 [Arsenophonus sp. NEOnobi-MAG3]